jgi:hypothetical protein
MAERRTHPFGSTARNNIGSARRHDPSSVATPDCWTWPTRRPPAS